MEYTKLTISSFNTIKEQIIEDRGFECTIPYTTREADQFLSQVLQVLLSEIGRASMHGNLEYILNELIMNASKANTKRLFFMENELDINNPDHYEQGMKNFKGEVFNDFGRFEQAHKDRKYFVTIEISIQNNNLLIKVENNSPFLKIELTRIGERLKRARKYTNLQEALSHGFDSEEGAGYGLIVIILMLRKMNLDEKSLKFEMEKGLSVVSLTIPLNLITSEHSVIIADKITEELRQMPSIPETILNLQEELNDPNCNFDSISKTLNADPSLAAEIIRIANSPIYKVSNKIDTVTAAVRLVGMLGVKAVLFNYGANKILEMKYNKKAIQELNDHSYAVAQAASFIIRYKKLKTIAEDVYVAALLHDMGKIIVNTIQKDLSRKLTMVCQEKHIPVSLLEDLTEGYNHSIIGAELARNWNFPKKFVTAIRYHHLPTEVPGEFKVITYAVYLGNELYYYLRGERDFADINFQVLEFFNLQKEAAFEELVVSAKVAGAGGL